MATEPDDAPVDLLPPEPTFLRKYSPQLELPISFLISTFLLLTMFGLLVVMMLLAIGDGPAKKVPPISLVEGGDDLEGNGSPGATAGGDGTPPSELVQPTQPQTPDQLPPSAVDVPKVREELEKNLVLDDPTLAGVAFNSDNAKNFLQLDDVLRKKLSDAKGPGGEGNSPDGKQPGDGKGGTGVENTRRRSLRWVLNFEIRSGRNYLDQLQSLGAVVMVPVPPDRKEMFIFRDLANPKPGTVATGEELQSFSQQIQFCDDKPANAQQIGQALGLNFTPGSFWAIFPKGIEEELARLETGFRKLRAEDIEQTKFAVSMVGGKYKLVVTDQVPRRR